MVAATMKGKTLTLNNLIAYQKDAVVSKTLVSAKKGTVTVFAFDKGQGLSEHKAPFDALVQIIDGSATIFIEEVAHTVKAGEMIIMPANKPHALQAKTKFQMMLIMIRA